MRIAITGGSGIVGGFIVAAAQRAGHEVVLLGRRAPSLPAPGTVFQPWELGSTPDLSGLDVLIHAAFSHLPGRYRGGEGDDPEGFMRRNRDGSLRLFEAARAAGLATVIQISSRAVFDGYPAGSLLREDLAPKPIDAYGRMKVELENALAAATTPDFRGISLRATGVYASADPRRPHKWTRLVNDLLRGKPIPSRVASEVHGADLAAAILLLLERAGEKGGVGSGRRQVGASAPAGMLPPVLHASDIVLDHRDLAIAVARHLKRSDICLPARSDAGRLSVLDCATLHRLGWRPGGRSMLEQSLPGMIAEALRHGPMR